MFYNLNVHIYSLIISIFGHTLNKLNNYGKDITENRHYRGLCDWK